MKRTLFVTAMLLMMTAIAQTAAASRYDGLPCYRTYHYNEPIDKLARDAAPHRVTRISDTSIRVTDRWGCYIIVTGLPAVEDTVTGGGSPTASTSIAVNKIVRRTIFTQAQPRATPRRPAPPPPPPDQPTPKQPFYESIPNIGRLNLSSADIFYNRWEIGSIEGQTFGLNPSATWGETYDLTLTMPLHIISPKDGDTVFGIGLDGAFKYPFTGNWENFMAGIHFYGMGFFGGDDTATTFGGGPFVGYSYRINPDWIISGGLLLELTKPNEADSITEIVPAVNLGYNLTDDVALNVYAMHFKNLDSDVRDDAYTDIGVEVSWVRGTWSLSGGVKTTTGLSNVKSTEIHLGSSWMF